LVLDVPWTKVDGTKSYVKELPNRAMRPDAYIVDAGDIRMVLEGLEEVEDIAIWHTHPSGNIGPSEGDISHRPHPGIWMLVVALTEHGPIPTWF
jgi:proteasome lid subunit RPN8/RPN11